MFGRRKTEDYDEYNERVNAKYDDDYVREGKEYRAECTHSHEQTYEDYTSVRDCDHEHGQTYSNYTKVDTPDYDRVDTDRRSYDSVGTSRSYDAGDGQAKEFFESRLLQGEHILYVGKSKSSYVGGGCAKAFIVCFFFFFVHTFISSFLQGLMSVVAGISSAVPELIALLITIALIVIALTKIGNVRSDFCITNKRLLIARGKNVLPVMLKDMTNVALTRAGSAQNGSNTHEYITYSHMGMNHILDAGDDNYNVFRVLQDAVKAAAERNKRS